MDLVYITFRSVTPAQRAERLLKKEGISCSLRRTPRWMEEKGCGYSLQLPYPQLSTAVKLLQEQSIPYKRQYLRRENGNWEALQL